MKSVELTDHEAHLIHEVFAIDTGPLFDEIVEVAECVGIMKEIGTGGVDELMDSIFDKTR